MTHPPLSTGAAASVVTHAMVSCRLSQIDGLRGGGWPAEAPPMPPRFLRQSDEQTVVGMHAVLAAIARLPEPRPSFERHGVVAASCHGGRITATRTLSDAFARGGVGVSIHVIPQCSLHSPASAVSVALGMHGPNIGVAGGPQAVAEGLLSACTWLRTGCDDVWLVVTGFDEEPALDLTGDAITDPVCRGVAACMRAGAAQGGLQLEFGFADAAAGGLEGTDAKVIDSPESFGRALSAGEPGVYQCGWGAVLRLTPCAEQLREAA